MESKPTEQVVRWVWSCIIWQLDFGKLVCPVFGYNFEFTMEIAWLKHSTAKECQLPHFNVTVNCLVSP